VEGLSQAIAANVLGVTQPRVSDLMRGRINLFSLDTLIDMAATAGLAPTSPSNSNRSLQKSEPLR